MWLLHTTTLELRQVTDASLPPYAILSHVWDKRCGEPSFQDTERLHKDIARLFGPAPRYRSVRDYLANRDDVSPKLLSVCAFAHDHGYEYIWTDTCCIDKTSSAELSEAINSMHTWYARSSVCYAYLQDVGDDEDPAMYGSQFRTSKWFTRGWTLQELVAPRNVVFLSQQWSVLGTKASLETVIEEITGIDGDVLTHQTALHSVSVAQRMSWAAERETTRVEDRAYSLLGIFGIHMPTIYGEGDQAFVRLQEEILRRIPDQTLFAWGRTLSCSSGYDLADFSARLINNSARRQYASSYLFASSPTEFNGAVASYAPIALPRATFDGTSAELPQYSMTSYGLRATLPIMDVTLKNGAQVHLALLACQDSTGRRVALVLSPEEGPNQYLLGGYRFSSPYAPDTVIYTHTPRALLIPSSLLSSVHVLPVHILYRRPDTADAQSVRFHPLVEVVTEGDSEPGEGAAPNIFTGPCKITIPRWTLSRLTAAGFAHNVTGPLLCVVPGDWHIVRLRRGAELIAVTISLCGPRTLASVWKRESSRKPPLHVDVVRYRMTPAGPVPSCPAVGDCHRCHVDEWSGGKSPARTYGEDKMSRSPGTLVRLTFSDWDSGRHDVPLDGTNAVVPFALHIDVFQKPYSLITHDLSSDYAFIDSDGKDEVAQTHLGNSPSEAANATNATVPASPASSSNDDSWDGALPLSPATAAALLSRKKRLPQTANVPLQSPSLSDLADGTATPSSLASGISISSTRDGSASAPTDDDDDDLDHEPPARRPCLATPSRRMMPPADAREVSFNETVEVIVPDAESEDEDEDDADLPSDKFSRYRPGVEFMPPIEPLSRKPEKLNTSFD